MGQEVEFVRETVRRKDTHFTALIYIIKPIHSAGFSN